MKHWQSSSVKSNGLRIHYHRTGGEKPVLILVHGFTDSGLCWGRAALELENEYDIIMLDARGHGLSDKPKHGYSRDDHAADVAGVIDSLDLDSVIVLGHSMGAMIALTLAANYPQLVRGVILEDPPWREESDRLYLETAEQVALLTDNWREKIAAQSQLPPEQIEAEGREAAPSWHADEFPAWVQSKQQVSPDVVGFVSIGNRRWLSLIEKFQCPALLITGSKTLGAITSPAITKQALAVNTRIQHTHIDDSGHNIHRENLPAFLSAVREFLTGFKR